jgi:predicted RNA binding protein YcfA (HicA-like mRNA interferase family)
MPKLPSLKPAELVKAFEKAGFTIIRQTGSHVILWKDGLPRTIPIPLHVKSLKRALQSKIIKEAGFTEDEFKEYL